MEIKFKHIKGDVIGAKHQQKKYFQPFKKIIKKQKVKRSTLQFE